MDAAFSRRPLAALNGSYGVFARRPLAALNGTYSAFTRRSWAMHDAFSGPCSISGTVSVLTAPASRPVYLLPMPASTLKTVRATRSAADGSYSFAQIAAGQWLVLGIDDTGAHQAVAVDRITTTAP